MIIGVDVDGVVADFVSALKPAAAEVLNKDVESLADDVDWNFGKWGCQNQEQFEHIYTVAASNNLWLNAPIIEGARTSLRRLTELGASVRLVTARPDPLPLTVYEEQAVSETAAWVREHRISCDGIDHVRRKTSTDYHIYVDDAPHHIKMLQEANKPVIVFDQSWNEDVEGLRGFGWNDTIELVIAHTVSKQK